MVVDILHGYLVVHYRKIPLELWTNQGGKQLELQPGTNGSVVKVYCVCVCVCVCVCLSLSFMSDVCLELQDRHLSGITRQTFVWNYKTDICLELQDRHLSGIARQTFV